MSPGNSDLKCTLVTPLRNEMDNISGLWQIIQDQTHRPDEWIIADNGSTDGTMEWLAEHAPTSAFPVQVLSLPGKTIAQIQNIAILKARYDIIASCHGGTRIPRDWLENILAPLHADPSVDVSAGIWEAYGETPAECWVAKSMYNVCELADENSYCPASRSMAFKRSAWEKAGGFPEWLPRFGEDTLFGIRLHAAGCLFRVADKAKVGWRPRPPLRPMFRKYYYHGEAFTLLGLAPLTMPVLFRFIFPWAGTLAIWIIYHRWLPAIIFFIAALITDHLALKSLHKRAYNSFCHYLLWEWMVRIADVAGRIHGQWLLASGRVHRPMSDMKAIQIFQTKT